jgi:ribosome-binding protein aMBF1 (putative translation factor)
MNTPINYQTIMDHGKPAFVVIPYDDFLRIYPESKKMNIENTTIPHDVVRKIVSEDISRIRAWREYLGLTQKEVSVRMNITQAALSQMEKPGAKLRKPTREKLAEALGISYEQLF